MEYRYLGRSGLEVSAVGLGTNAFGVRMDAEESAQVLHQTLDLGINFIDTANVYGDSEEFIGRALNGKRHQVILATKVGRHLIHPPNQGGSSRRHIMEQVEISLRRLRTDYIDLYKVHIPDPSTPIEESLRALDDLVHQGKVRYIGCSNFSAWQTCEAVWTSRTLNLEPFGSVEVEYSLVQRSIERELVPFCQAYRIGIIPYLPLAGGFLTGKYRPGEPVPEATRFHSYQPEYRQRFLTERNFAILDRLEPFAREREHTIGELAIAWLLGNPLVSSVISGATKPEQIMANAKGADWHLTSEEMEEISGLGNQQ